MKYAPKPGRPPAARRRKAALSRRSLWRRRTAPAHVRPSPGSDAKVEIFSKLPYPLISPHRKKSRVFPHSISAKTRVFVFLSRAETLKGEPAMKTFAELGFPGRLIAVEGLDGSGK